MGANIRIEQLKDFLNADPQDSFLKHALALEYIKEGNDGEAQRLFEEVLAHEPGYVGSYYHLAKLLERKGDVKDALITYEKGMVEAKREGDTHAYNELLNPKEELEDN
jgi:Tfp pilus assembly protein PilF